MSDAAAEVPPAMLDAFDYPDPDDLADEVFRRLRFHTCLIVSDPSFDTFPEFMIVNWRGVFAVRGQGDRRLGTFASIEAAIRAGRTASRDHEAGDERADALA